jgi:hypothetical protein
VEPVARNQVFPRFSRVYNHGTFLDLHDGTEGGTFMPLKFIAVVAVAAVLAVAPPVLAWGGGGGGNGGNAVAGSFTGGSGDGSFSGSCQGNVCTGTVTLPGGETRTGTFTVTSEPLTALVVGLGLLGARYLRRR